MPETRRFLGRLDYRCTTCDMIHRDLQADFVEVPEETRLYKGEHEKLPVRCPVCGTAMDTLPPKTHNDLLSEFMEIDLVGDGPKRYSSLREVRAVEAATLKAARNKEGIPMIVRGFSQDHSNMSVNTLHGSEFEKGRSQRPDMRTSKGRPIPGGAYTPQD